MKEYIKVTGNPQFNFLRVEFDYDLGGWNYFTGGNEPRGYYIHVTPMDRQDRGGYFMETMVAFSGVKGCLLTVTRKSKKAEENARAIFEQEKEKYINYVLNKHNLTIEEV